MKKQIGKEYIAPREARHRWSGIGFTMSIFIAELGVSRHAQDPDGENRDSFRLAAGRDFGFSLAVPCLREKPGIDFSIIFMTGIAWSSYQRGTCGNGSLQQYGQNHPVVTGLGIE